MLDWIHKSPGIKINALYTAIPYVSSCFSNIPHVESPSQVMYSTLKYKTGTLVPESNLAYPQV